jgi:hypothetical protein
MASLLMLTTLLAILLFGWRVATYVPPTDRIAAYAKAPSTRGTWFDVGPN